MYMTIKLISSALLAAAALGCAPSVSLPSVHEALDSEVWGRCAGELELREATAMIDDLTLDAKTLLCQGVALAATGEVDEGLELLTESGVRDKEDHRPHYLSGRILAQEGRYEEALTAFERSAKRFPTMEVPSERLARTLIDADKKDEARIFLGKTRERDLCPYGCQGLYARLLKEAGEADEAKKVYEGMIELEPEEPAAYVGLASVANQAKDHAGEAAQLGKATQAKKFATLSEKERADIFYSLAFAHYNAGEHERASMEMDRALGLNGERADWHLLAGWIELKRDQPEAAESAFDKAVSLDPAMGAAHAGLGDALLAANDASGATDAYRTARELDATNAVYVLKLAHAIAVDGDLETARQLIDEAAELDKEHLPPDLLGKVTDLIKATEKKSGEE